MGDGFRGTLMVLEWGVGWLWVRCGLCQGAGWGLAGLAGWAGRAGWLGWSAPGLTRSHASEASMAWRESSRLCGGLLLSFFSSPPSVRPLPTLVGLGLWVRGRHTPLPGVGSGPYPQVYPRKQRCVCEFVGVGGVGGVGREGDA